MSCIWENVFQVQWKEPLCYEMQIVEEKECSGSGSDSSSNSSEYGHIDSVTIREKVNAVSQEIIKAEMMV